jgi:DNA-binding response OmpR family regulator
MEKEKASVLFLEDDPVIREVLTEYMHMSGYRVTEAQRGDDAISLLARQQFHLAVLDICVPGVDGFGVLKYIQENCRTAVIMLTALGDEQSQVKAFNLYADDYVIKPVSPIILLKRMETILRRVVWQEGGTGEEGLVLKEESYCAFFGGQKLPLTLTEYLLLQKLYHEPERVFTREQLILGIFNEDYIGNDRIIDAHVKNLRKKLPLPCIKTVIGVGYQFDRTALKAGGDTGQV